MSIGRVVVFIDILGFKQYLNYDTEGAKRLLLDQKQTLTDRNNDSDLEIPEDQVSSFKKRHSVSEFECFLPSSDSIFILSSRNHDLFCYQLVSFLFDSFMLSTLNYEHPKNRFKPEKVDIIDIRYLNNDVSNRLVEENWFPCLVRGGIGIGNAELLPNNQHKIVNSKFVGGGAEILIGDAVNEAVFNESIVKGPRIIVSNSFVNSLKARTRLLFTDIKELSEEKEDDKKMELLWPIGGYLTATSSSTLETNYIDYMVQILSRSIVLWKANCTKPYYNQYWQLLILVVNSFLKYVPQSDEMRVELKRLMKHTLDQYKIGGISDFLFENADKYLSRVLLALA